MVFCFSLDTHSPHGGSHKECPACGHLWCTHKGQVHTPPASRAFLLCEFKQVEHTDQGHWPSFYKNQSKHSLFLLMAWSSADVIPECGRETNRFLPYLSPPSFTQGSLWAMCYFAFLEFFFFFFLNVFLSVFCGPPNKPLMRSPDVHIWPESSVLFCV